MLVHRRSAARRIEDRPEHASSISEKGTGTSEEVDAVGYVISPEAVSLALGALRQESAGLGTPAHWGHTAAAAKFLASEMAQCTLPALISAYTRFKAETSLMSAEVLCASVGGGRGDVVPAKPLLRALLSAIEAPGEIQDAWQHYSTDEAQGTGPITLSLALQLLSPYTDSTGCLRAGDLLDFIVDHSSMDVRGLLQQGLASEGPLGGLSSTLADGE